MGGLNYSPVWPWPCCQSHGPRTQEESHPPKPQVVGPLTLVLAVDPLETGDVALAPVSCGQAIIPPTQDPLGDVPACVPGCRLAILGLTADLEVALMPGSSPSERQPEAVRHFAFVWSAHSLGFSLSAVQGFSSERDFEDYVKQENNSQRVMVAFVFDHEFRNSHDPLPLKVRTFSVEVS